MIVLEEEVIPAKDFLHFLSQCWTSLNNDATLVGISGWNENGEVRRRDAFQRLSYLHSLGAIDIRGEIENR